MSTRRKVTCEVHLWLPVLVLWGLLTSCTPMLKEVKFPSGDLVLHGFVYKPEGNGPFPAVLYNHGSERRPGWKPELGELFTSQGYVLFIPHRQGQGRSPGEYIRDLLPQRKFRLARSRRLVELMEIHLKDQITALSYLKSLPYVDSDRIAVAGCSFGGIQTVLISERKVGLRAAISFAGAAQTWRRLPDLRERMLSAVRNATIPILLIQAKNDYNLAPSRALAEELKRLRKPHKLVIFPPFGNTAAEGHGGFCSRGGNVWGSEVFSFLSTAM